MVVVVMMSMWIFGRAFGLAAAGIAGTGAACRSGVSVAVVQIAVYAFAGETEVLVSLRGRVMLLLGVVHLGFTTFLHRMYALTATTSAGVVVEAAVALGFELVTLVLLVHLATVGSIERVVMLVMGTGVMMM